MSLPSLLQEQRSCQGLQWPTNTLTSCWTIALLLCWCVCLCVCVCVCVDGSRHLDYLNQGLPDVNSVLFLFFFLSSDSVRSSGKIPEEAVVDEEAILSLLESSQTFLPLSQTSNHSSLLGTVATGGHLLHIPTQLLSSTTLFVPFYSFLSPFPCPFSSLLHSIKSLFKGIILGNTPFHFLAQS